MTPPTFNNQDAPWICEHRRADISARQKLIDAAKEGCKDAVKALRAEPHCIKTLILDGRRIL